MRRRSVYKRCIALLTITLIIIMIPHLSIGEEVRKTISNMRVIGHHVTPNGQELILELLGTDGKIYKSDVVEIVEWIVNGSLVNVIITNERGKMNVKVIGCRDDK